MNNKIKFGLVGCGRIGGRHAEEISKVGLLKAVCDIDSEKAKIENYPQKSEGWLSKRKAMLVSKEVIAKKALDMNLGDYLRLGKGEIKSSTIPGGDYVATIHEGPYDSMEPAYEALTQWVQNNGYQPTGIAYEYYLNDPGESDDTIALTEIRFPVKKI